MRGLWCVASIATANSASNNVSSVLSSLDVGAPSAAATSNNASNGLNAAALMSALGTISGGTQTESKNPINVSQLIQAAVGDGTNPGLVTYLKALGINTPQAAAASPAPVTTADLGIEKQLMEATDQLDLAKTVLTDPTSLMNQSSLVNLFPALTGGILTNASAGNLIGLLNNGERTTVLSSISGVMRDPQVLSSAAALTNSPTVQNASTLSNISSSIKNGLEIGSAIVQKDRSLLQNPPSETVPTADQILAARKLNDASAATGGLDLSALANSFLGGANSGGLNLGTLASGLLGGASGGGINLSSLTNSLLGGGTGTTSNTNSGLSLNSLANSLQSLTSGLGAVDTFQALANSTMPLAGSTAANTVVQGNESSSALQGVAATLITNNYLNPSGQIAMKSTPFAQKALQYPDLLAVLNGQAPICSADGQLTPAVQTALKQISITATTPAALISTISSTDSQDQSTNLLVNPLSSLAGTTNANAALSNANSMLEDSQKALQDSLASLTNGASATTSIQDLLNSLNNGNASAGTLNSLLSGISNQSRLLEAEDATEATVATDSEREEIKGLREALLHFNEALKKAIKANENIAAEAEVSTDLSESEADASHRMLQNWFSSTWEKIKNTFGGSDSSDSRDDFLNTDWKSDVNQAAQELADNLNSMADKIRGTDIAEMIENWFDEARKELSSKGHDVLPNGPVGPASESPARGFIKVSPNLPEQVAMLRSLAGFAKDGAFAAGHDGYNFQSLSGGSNHALSSGIENYNFQAVGNDQRHNALSSGVDEYNFQSVTNPQKNHALGAGVEGYSFQSANQVGDDDHEFQQAAPNNLFSPDLLGSQLFPNNGMLAGIQPVLNSLTMPFLGAINTLGAGTAAGGGLLQNNPLQQLLNGNNNGLRLFQGDGTDNVVQASASAETVTQVTPDLQQLQQVALMLQQIQQLQPTAALEGNESIAINQLNNLVQENQTDAQTANDSNQSTAKTLNSIDVKEWINKLSNTELGKTFGLDQLDTSKLPVLPDIEDADLEKFMENHDWTGVFNNLRLSDLPGLEQENESSLKQLVKDGKFGEILARVNLSQVPGLENVDVNAILKEFEEQNASVISGTSSTEKADDDDSDSDDDDDDDDKEETDKVEEKERSLALLQARRQLQIDAASIIQSGANTLSNSLTGGATSTLTSGSQSLLNQLQGITNLANGLTGLSSGLGYGLTNLNTNALTGSSLLSSGIGNLLGNVNTGLGTNLNSLGSGLQGLTNSIGTNLSTGLGSTGSNLGSGQLNLFDLSSLANLLPTNGASTIASSVESAVQPVLSSYNLTSARDTSSNSAATDTTASSNPVAVLSETSSDANPVQTSSSAGTTTTTTLDSDQLASLLASLNQGTTTGTSSNSQTTSQSPGTALQILHAFVGMRRMLNTATTQNSPIDLLNSLTAQLTSRTGTNSASSLMDSLNSSLNLNNLSSTSGANSLNSLLSSLSSNGAASSTPSTTNNASNTSNAQFQSASASTGVVIPDLQSILGGNYKQVQSATGASDITSMLSNASSAVPDISSLLNSSALSGLPDLSSLISGQSSNSALNNLLSSTTANLPSMATANSAVNSFQIPSTSDLLNQLNLGNSSSSITDTINNSLAALNSNTATNSLTSNLNQGLSSLTAGSTPSLPDLSSLLQGGSSPSSLTDLTSSLLSQLSLPTAAPVSNVVPENAGDHVLSALNDIKGRVLTENSLVSAYIKEIEREEVLAEAMLSNEYRRQIEQIKNDSGPEVAQAENAQMKIAILEADYKAKMKAIGELAQAQKLYAVKILEKGEIADPASANVNSGHDVGQKTAQSPAVVVTPVMGNSVSNSGGVSRRLLLGERVINLQPNSLINAADLSSTPEPHYVPEHYRPEEWIEEYIPPVLRSVLNMISSVEPLPPPYRTMPVPAEKSSSNTPQAARRLQQLMNQPFRVDNPANPAAELQHSIDGNLPAFNAAVLKPSYIDAWQPNGSGRISGFYPYGGGDNAMGSVSGALGFDIGQFPGSSAISSANQMNMPNWQAAVNTQNQLMSQYNPLELNQQFQSIQGADQFKDLNSADIETLMNNNNFSPVLGEKFDPISILTAISNSDLDVPGLFQILAKSNVDWNTIVTKLRNGSTFETLVPEMINQGLDVPAILALVNKSNLNLNAVLREEPGYTPKSDISTLEDLLAQLDGLDLNALIKSTAVSGIDLKSVILMLSKDGVDLQSVADSPVMPIIGHAAAMSQLEGAFEPRNDAIDPHHLLYAMENVEHELAPL